MNVGSRSADGRDARPGRGAMHTFVAYVEDRPGVLARVAGLFSRRAYNIASLAVGRTDVEGVSRMTIVVECADVEARLVEANLYKQVTVLFVADVTNAPTVARDLALIKVATNADQRPRVLEIVDFFRARVVDVAPAALIVESTGTEDKLQGLLEVLRPFGIIEMVRTGSIAITRGAAAVAPNSTFAQVTEISDGAL